jgi:hypothetical protein
LRSNNSCGKKSIAKRVMFVSDPTRPSLGHESGDHAALDDEGEVAGAQVVCGVLKPRAIYGLTL